MKKITIGFLFLVAVLAFAGVREAQAQRCKITDPTGTPLNVRASPNGRILRKIANGTVVIIEDTSYDSKNRGWLNLKQTLEKGELTDRGNDVDEDGNELAWKYQIVSKNRMRRLLDTI